MTNELSTYVKILCVWLYAHSLIKHADWPEIEFVFQTISSGRILCMHVFIDLFPHGKPNAGVFSSNIFMCCSFFVVLVLMTAMYSPQWTHIITIFVSILFLDDCDPDIIYHRLCPHLTVIHRMDLVDLVVHRHQHHRSHLHPRVHQFIVFYAVCIRISHWPVWYMPAKRVHAHTFHICSNTNRRRMQSNCVPICRHLFVHFVTTRYSANGESMYKRLISYLIQ